MRQNGSLGDRMLRRVAISMDQDTSLALRALPAVGAVLEALRQRSAEARRSGSELLTYLVRRAIERRRRALATRSSPVAEPQQLLEAIVAETAEELVAWRRQGPLRRVVNATGVILHSGLGRAALPGVATEALARAAGYVLLEVDPETGRRRRRDAFVEELLCSLTGAEAALVVNNNAAATVLALNTLAAGKEVVVSRSQLVEIGGSFRLPEVMAASGCRLREVGTTNRTRPDDYEAAVGNETAALLLVHTSNYRIVGFTAEVGIEELVAVGRRLALPVLHDLGSGCLIDPGHWGIGPEPPVARSVRAGADLVFFSGDKMIGGVQAGILLGGAPRIERLRTNPLARALRVDKLTLLALEAVLRLYLEPSRLADELPTLRMLREPPESVAGRARSLVAELCRQLDGAAEIEAVPETSQAGGGALPAADIPTTCVAVRHPGLEAGELARALRLRPVPVFTRIADGRVLIDPRTLQAGEERLVVEALVAVLGAAPAAER